MARIRTIKPEFWTDEKIVQLPFTARLVFIGLWNFADDDGRLKDEPDRLRMQIMPGDPVDMTLALDVLVAAELVERWYGPDGSVILQIPGFGRHQVISHKAKSKLSLDAYKKAAIPAAARRQVARKYGCEPGNQNHPAECYFCGAPGSVYWPKRSDGRPSAYVAFSDLELDHFTPEHSGGTGDEKNLVLSCRCCNRGRKNRDAHEFFRKNSGAIQNSPPGREGKGKEGKGKDSTPGPVETHPAQRTLNCAASVPEKPQPAEPAKAVEPAPGRAWASRENFDRIEKRCREALPDRGPQDLQIGPMARLEADGLDLEAEIIPVLLDVAASSRVPIRTWRLYADRVAERVALQRQTRAAQGLPEVPKAPPRPEDLVDMAPHGRYPEATIRQWVARHRENPGTWNETVFGPPPGAPSCKVPPRLLIGEAA